MFDRPLYGFPGNDSSYRNADKLFDYARKNRGADDGHCPFAFRPDGSDNGVLHGMDRVFPDPYPFCRLLGRAF